MDELIETLNQLTMYIGKKDFKKNFWGTEPTKLTTQLLTFKSASDEENVRAHFSLSNLNSWLVATASGP